MLFKKIRLFLILVPTLGFLIVTMDFCSYATHTSRRLLKESMQKQYDMVVVPGVPLENGQWSKVMKARVYWSKYLYDKGIAKNLMYSGSAVYTPYVEAKVMALYAEAIGIKKENIFLEPKAEHSTENIYYGYKHAKKLGFKTIALASDPFQTKMLSSFTKTKLNRDVALIPIVFDTLQALEPSMIDPTIDHQQAFVKDFVPLPKRESFWKRFRGTMGKNLDTTAYQ
jgi:DUF218 domain